MIKINKNKIKRIVKEIPYVLGTYAFISFLVFVVISIVFGFFMFYKYGILAKNYIPKKVKPATEINKGLYHKILDKLDKRQKVFNNIGTKNYKDPFKEPIIVPKKESLTK